MPLANVTLSGSASSVTFSSINQGYRDLVLVVKTTNSPLLRFNSDSTNNYPYVAAWGNGSSTGSYSETTTGFGGTWNGGSNSQIMFQIMDYSQTNKYKPVLITDARATSAVQISAGRWTSTAAITTAALVGTFVSGDTFALYGVSA